VDSSGKSLSAITVPTLVVHGTADPMFPIEHGEALAREIRGARPLPLERAGHGIFRDDWDTIACAILRLLPAERIGPEQLRLGRYANLSTPDAGP